MPRRSWVGGLVALALCVSGEAGAQSDFGRFGLEAYRAGDYAMAEDFLKKAIAHEYEKDEHKLLKLPPLAEARTKELRKALAAVYWETLRDHELMDFAEAFLPPEEQHTWWCRVLERRGHTTYAEECWREGGYEARFKRAARSRLLKEAFAPDGTVYGHRPLPPYPERP